MTRTTADPDSMISLAAYRLADMRVMHRDQDNSHRCSTCGETVGIYPSDQAVIAAHPKVTIVCNHCISDSDLLVAAHGAIEEALNTRKRRP